MSIFFFLFFSWKKSFFKIETRSYLCADMYLIWTCKLALAASFHGVHVTIVSFMSPECCSLLKKYMPFICLDTCSQLCQMPAAYVCNVCICLIYIRMVGTQYVLRTTLLLLFTKLSRVQFNRELLLVYLDKQEQNAVTAC